ncbi:hypothetical protein C7C46_18050 [Streptomyces tateyamensis]|uniref:DUF2207 domain-containing protein n=1 Tax=Streptomyces tateyamensis TaxID=565073 RepID=A0A2V4NNY3_9ACTN|nr:hypothetical protein [Streptomyces tateyamensis]PYC77696.1 hypothetical protein C7C46_18050 [Streptomyces tateyamensis]
MAEAGWAVVAGVLLLGWLAGLAAALGRARRRAARGRGERADPGTLAPALGSLIAGGGRLRGTEAAATLLDLVARGVLGLTSTGPGPSAALVTVVGEASGPAGFERLVLERVTGYAQRGSLPLAALARGGPQQHAEWEREFAQAVREAGRAQGLLVDRLDRAARLRWTALAVPFAAAGWPARGPWAAGPAFLLAAALVAYAGRRPVVTARADRARWRALGAQLRGEAGWAVREPAGVAAGERRFAHAVAQGAAPVAARAVSFGPEHHRRAWAAHGGWHEVRLHRSRWRGTLLAPVRAAWAGGLGCLAGAGALAVLGYTAVLRDGAGQPFLPRSVLLLYGAALLAVFLPSLVCCLVGLHDLGHRRVVTGELVRVHRSTREGKEPSLLAVNSGHGRAVWLLPVRTALLDGLTEGQSVRLVRSHWLWFVHQVEPSDGGAQVSLRP